MSNNGEVEEDIKRIVKEAIQEVADKYNIDLVLLEEK